MVFCVLEKLSLWLSAKIGWKLCHASIKLAALEIYNVIIWCPFLFPFKNLSLYLEWEQEFEQSLMPRHAYFF
jgi:hypothetical protein